MGGIRMTRPQLEAIFGRNSEGIVQMELLLELIDTINNTGLDASRINLDTTNFSVVLSAADTNVQLAMDTIDNITTTKVPEGSNLYFTNERVDDRVAALIQNGTGLTWTYVDGSNTLTGNVSLSVFDTDDLAEGVSNLYFTNERVDDRVSALVQNGSGITWTYDDAGNTLTGNTVWTRSGIVLSPTTADDVLKPHAYRENVTTVAGNSTLTHTMTYVRQTARGITTTLWASPVSGDRVTIRNRGGGTNTIDGNGTDIEGSASISIYDGESFDLVYDGSEWTV